MSNQFAKIFLFPLSIVSAIAVATVPFTESATAQRRIGAIADGNMTEYSPSSAPLLRRGSRSQAVKDVQLLLNQNKFYYGRMDGIYGPRMYSSVVSFQRSRNLPATGVINSKTWEALIDLDKRNSPTRFAYLGKYSPSTAPMLRLGSRGRAVRDVQTFLKQQGFYVGQVDGIYGRATASAVKSFQQNRAKLRADGIVGSTTWQAMINDKKGPFAIR
ncbi:putative peptidoglycan-binding domain-containing protein [Rivularia sp. PCC 7116]|uniref:peptidoglycan-binding domain-containing protein n=1 Tax=Rivularia sp. PCC 7116 TaxID=373994 RepID=UPI00029F4C9B|nr:peptidoglycan-binding protein [Rivularia sp. PCC 7116]AFY55257.1 putative peptidoglycan-binding domain-containing protein [Rivularia sp. PCC 7116]